MTKAKKATRKIVRRDSDVTITRSEYYAFRDAVQDVVRPQLHHITARKIS